ncbi:MAG: glycosyltransferase family 39 protein [Myxococcota bacterium]|nr:glycosyltransferase family 39 protein [Myxococcota bacterium]
MPEWSLPFTLQPVHAPINSDERRIGILLTAVTFVFFAIGMDSGSHYDSDDALYAEMARSMWVSGDWVDNRWSGTVLFEKPPLLIWSMALSGGIGGWSEAALRLPLTCFAALAIWSLFGIYGRLGLSSLASVAGCLLLLTSFYFVMMSRRLMTDLPLVACSLYSLQMTLSGHWKHAGVGAGLAILAKGVAAGPLIFSIMLVAFLANGLDWRTALRGVGTAAAVAILVAGPWHLLATLRHGTAFWAAYIGHHVGDRATRPVVPGISLRDLLVLVLQDAVLVFGACVALIRSAWVRNRTGKITRAVWVGGLWSVFAFLPMVISSTRLPHYAFPLIIGLALMAPAAVPSDWWRRRYASWCIGSLVVVIFAASPGRMALWIDADLAPDQKALGELMARHAKEGDVTATFNTTTAALTFYSGGKRVEMFAADPRFLAIQQSILMNQMVGQVHPIGDGPITHPEGKHRYVVTRQTDLEDVVSRFQRGNTARAVSVVEASSLVLVNDAGLGRLVLP